MIIDDDDNDDNDDDVVRSNIFVAFQWISFLLIRSTQAEKRSDLYVMRCLRMCLCMNSNIFTSLRRRRDIQLFIFWSKATTLQVFHYFTHFLCFHSFVRLSLAIYPSSEMQKSGIFHCSKRTQPTGGGKGERESVQQRTERKRKKGKIITKERTNDTVLNLNLNGTQ